MQHQKILAAFVAVCLSVGTLAAQIVPQNRHDTIVLSVYNANQRFMLYQAPFGTPMPTTTVLVDMVAAYDTAFVWQQATVADSTEHLPMQQVIAHRCDKLTGDVRNKVAIIHLNPSCDASQTFFNAQKAGAKAAILIHTTNSKDSVWLSFRKVLTPLPIASTYRATPFGEKWGKDVRFVAVLSRHRPSRQCSVRHSSHEKRDN